MSRFPDFFAGSLRAAFALVRDVIDGSLSHDAEKDYECPVHAQEQGIIYLPMLGGGVRHMLRFDRRPVQPNDGNADGP
jgi:hypothetical protein